MFTFPVGFLAQDDPYTQNDPYWNNVSLLLPMTGTNGSTTFTDYSPTPKTVTANGNAQISTAQSAFGGGSGLFDGSGDYLTIPNSVGLQLGSGDFTIEFWQRYTSFSNYQSILRKGYVSGGDYILQTGLNSGAIVFYASGTAVLIEPGSLNAGQWYYVAITRSGTTVNLSRDGAVVASGTSSVNFTSTASVIVAEGTNGPLGYYYNGYLNDIRITKGIARDVSVIPSAPFPVG